MSWPPDPTTSPPTKVDLDVRDSLPLALAGRLVAIGDDHLVHAFHFDAGRVTYLARPIDMGAAVRDLVVFDGSVLVHGDDSSVRQLDLDAGTSRWVDLAGHRQTVDACPTHDPVSGELHVVAGDWGGAQRHVVVPAGALTRRSRLIVDARARIHGLAIGRDHIVFVADGLVAVAPRSGDAHAAWWPTGVAAPRLVHTHRAGTTIIVLALTPSLERWILRPEGAAIEREVLDPTPRHRARIGSTGADGTPRRVWTTGAETIDRHDLLDARHTSHRMWPSRPGDFVIVLDGARPAPIDGGWFVGLVHDASTVTTDLRVADSADLDVVATVRIPRPLPHGIRCAWIPSPSGDAPPSPGTPPSPGPPRPRGKDRS